jgi:uncharacterized protein RhaS with RHS repeats
MQARYYDPVIGRFMSNDPIGFRDVHSFNRYAYANNNPYKYVDPDGNNPAVAIARLAAPPISSNTTTVASGDSHNPFQPSGKPTTPTITAPNISPVAVIVTIGALANIPPETIASVVSWATQKGSDNTPRSTLPRDESGNYLPDADADGSHTTLGVRQGSNGETYTQGATFDQDGNFTGRTDVTDHGRPSNHSSPHVHPATGPNSVGKAEEIK